MEKLVAIVLMAGLSTRFGGPKNKQLCLLKGKSVFSYSIEAFANAKSIDELILVVNKTNESEISDYVKSKNIKALIVLGGETRQESVEKGLAATKLASNDIVIIHDGARPLVDEKIIISVAKAAKECGAATTYIESVDTVAKMNKKNEVESFVERSSVALIQTPQAFRFSELIKAHAKAKGNLATDDCSLILSAKGKVKLVPGSNKLHKITTKEDIKYLEGYID